MIRSVRIPFLKTGLILGAGLALAAPMVAFADRYDDGYQRDGYYGSCDDRKSGNAAGGAVTGAIIGGAAASVPGAIVGATIGGSAGADSTRCRYYRDSGYAYDDRGYDDRRSAPPPDPRYRDGYYDDRDSQGDAYRQGYRDGYRDHYRLQYDYSDDR